MWYSLRKRAYCIFPYSMWMCEIPGQLPSRRGYDVTLRLPHSTPEYHVHTKYDGHVVYNPRVFVMLNVFRLWCSLYMCCHTTSNDCVRESIYIFYLISFSVIHLSHIKTLSERMVLSSKPDEPNPTSDTVCLLT